METAEILFTKFKNEEKLLVHTESRLVDAVAK